MSAAEMRAAAALAVSPVAGSGEGTAPEGIDPERVVELLRANKVPLLEIAGGALAGSSAWRGAAAREERERAGLQAEFRAVSERLRSEGIVPVLFKSPGGFPYRSSNVDLLVRPRHFPRAAALLEKLGHLRLPHYREDHKLLFRRFRHGRSVICVHLHEAVSWGRLLILPGDEVVDRSRVPEPGLEPGFRVACAEDLLLITLAHSLYETDQIRLCDLRALRACAGEPEFDWRRTVGRARSLGWSAGLGAILTIAAALERSLYGASRVPPEVLESARSELALAVWERGYAARAAVRLEAAPPASLPYPISRAYSKLHSLALLARAPGRAPDERLVDVIATGWSLLANRLKLRCRPAALVSLSGLDGSGKSSAVRALQEAMALCEIPSRVVWSRGGFTVPVQAAKRAARAALRGRVPGPAEAERKRRWLSGPLAGAGFAAVVVVEQAIHYLLRVRIRLPAGVSILCDRFAYDAAADLEAKLGPGRRLAAAAGHLTIALAPVPDLSILLRLGAASAARRKPGDAPPEALQRQAAALDRLAATYGLATVDADRPDEEVIGEVVERSLRAVFARFGGRRR